MSHELESTRRAGGAPEHRASFERPASPPRRTGTAVYVHTPFCAIKCSYCNFFSGIRKDGESEAYFEGLAAELAHHARRGRLADRRFDTLYVGGGTPTALGADELQRLFALLQRHLDVAADAEITSEANPESLTPDKAALLRELGVNRISMGAQSFHDDELQRLSRPHDAAAIATAMASARAAGFDNVSLDLIYGLPGQTLSRWQASVERALELDPDHISAYCLIVEAGTPLAADVKSRRQPRPDDDLQREQFDWTVQRLTSAGYEFYELSNFAKPGRRSEHNLRYWLGHPWLGLGPSAHAFLDGARAANPANLDLYRRRFIAPEPQDPFRPVSRENLIFERVFMNLRLIEGMDLGRFEEEFARPLTAFYPGVVERLVTDGLLERANGRIRLAPRAWFVSDGVFAEFAP